MRQHAPDHRSLFWLAQPADGEYWRAFAACASADPELFFPVSASASNLPQVAEAKAVCGSCPVRRQCLAYATQTRQLHGIWGGMTEEERYSLVRAARQSARVPANTVPTDGGQQATPPVSDVPELDR
jgi:WhiB family redox-sensing transcriptional regulator